MTRPEPETSEWISSGIPVRGVRGVALAILALGYHVFSLQWLRAPSWKNKGEARQELRRIVSERSGHSYSYWTTRLGQKERLEFTTAAGTWYQADIEPVWDDEPGGMVRVLFSLDDGGRGAYHPMTESLLIQNDERA